MKEGYMLDLVIYDTREMKKGKPPNNIDYDLVMENVLDNDQFLSSGQVVERLRLLHDALETYKEVEKDNEPILEEMRLGVDGLILAMCQSFDCDEEE